MRVRSALLFGSFVIAAVSVFDYATAIPTGDRLWPNDHNGNSKLRRVERSGENPLEDALLSTKQPPQPIPMYKRKGFHVLAIATGVYLLISLLLTPLLLACCVCQGSGGDEVVEQKIEKGGETTTEDDHSAYR